MGGETLRMAAGGGSPTLPGLLEGGLLRALAAQGVPRCWVRLAWVCCRSSRLDLQVGVPVGGEETVLVPASHLPAHLLQPPRGPASGSKRAQAPDTCRQPGRGGQGNIVGVSFFPLLT